MRWNSDRPSHSDVRQVRRFLFFPERARIATKMETRWLEMATLEERYLYDAWYAERWI